MGKLDRLWPRWREDLVIVVATGIFAGLLCFTTPSILRSLDYVLMWKPVWSFFTGSLREGVVPLWNPYIGLGRPFVADSQNAFFYPPMYLIFLGQPAGIFLLIWLHCLLAAFGMRRLAGIFQIGRLPAYFIMLSFVASGPLTARWATGQLPYCWALCYAPWLFYSVVRTNEPWRLRHVAIHAFFLAAQFLCGNPQVFWFTTIGQAAFILARPVGLPVRAALAQARREILQFSAALLWSLLLVAAILLPFLELVGQGNRTAPTPAFANSVSLDWGDLTSLFSPLGISGMTAGINWETNLFVGAIVVVLGVGGLCRLREPNVRGLFGVLVIGLLLALGDRTPAFDVFYRWLPGFAGFRCHARAAFLLAFALVCASGIWLSRPHPGLRAFLTANFNLPLRYFAIGLILLQGLDLAIATRHLKFAYSVQTPGGEWPDFPFSQTMVEQLRQAGQWDPSQPPPRVCVPRTLVPANDAMLYRYSTFDAYFSLFLRRPWDYLHRILGLSPPELLNASVSETVYTLGPFPYADLGLAAGVDPLTHELHFATNVLPRAFLVYAAEIAPGYDQVLSRLTNGFDIRKSALLETPLPAPLPSVSAQPATPVPIHLFQAGSILLDVDARQNALLVLAENWYPGWRADIDGHTVPCVPVNAWMRGVPISAGRHQIRVFFHQDYLLSGLLISAAAFCFLVLALIFPTATQGAGRPAFVVPALPP